MAVILEALVQILRKPTAFDIMLDLLVFVAPLWVAVLAGLLIGWAWRPRWIPAGQSSCSSSGFQRNSADERKTDGFLRGAEEESAKTMVGDEDLHHLCQLVEMTDGGLPWNKMMDKSMPNFSYQAWCRQPENGPPEYKSSTIYEDTAPEIVRDFFWDDEFRISNGWDDMLLQYKILEECPTTGTMIVQWVRKFPFFCSDREYIIARRIWQSGDAFYCVTKGIQYDSVPRRTKPRRVDLYYSSWCIRPAKSKRDGQMTACEVLLFHHEDMGIPWSIAKLGVKQGMWGCVKKIEPGLRAYQIARNSNQRLSRSAQMAPINTKFDLEQMKSMDSILGSSSDIVEAKKHKHWAGSVPRFLVIGSAVALACSIDKGLLTKALIFGVARRFAKQGKNL